jgi:hypothetical protein
MSISAISDRSPRYRRVIATSGERAHHGLHLRHLANPHRADGTALVSYWRATSPVPSARRLTARSHSRRMSALPG